ncbi:MAG: NUDIX domain-containing protein [Actinomycetota bacterium]|nr:NUDIX domain-containing protein [Actinomycetota bacterium]
MAEVSASFIVSLAVTRRQGTSPNLLLQRRLVEQEYWQTWELPQGHLEQGESVVEAARRELAEETGLELDELSVEYSAEQSHGLIVEGVSPLSVAIASGSRIYLGICLSCEALGELRENSTEANDRQAWFDRSAVKRLLDAGTVFPLNRPMLEAWLAATGDA